MRAIVQRVSHASVSVDGVVTGAIGSGLLVLLGVARNDTTKEAGYLVEKITHLRVFNDPAGKMNLSVFETGGEILVISQFTLYGDCRKGRRPSFDRAAAPGEARPLYEHFLERIGATGLTVAAGIFQAHMEVSSTNIGPVTLVIDSDESDG